MKIGYIIIGSKKFEIHGKYKLEDGFILEIKDLMPGHFKMLMEDFRNAIEHIEFDTEALMKFLEESSLKYAEELEKRRVHKDVKKK